MARRILVPYDGSLQAHCAVVEAVRGGAETTLLGVIPRPAMTVGLSPEQRAEADADARRRLGALLAQTCAEFGTGVRVETVIRDGDPAEEILAAIAEGHFDAVIMGASSHGPFHSMRKGRVATTVCSCSSVPVLVTPAIPWRGRRSVRQRPVRARHRSNAIVKRTALT
jgi:nucleotide-binding universal stress UspA family protein